jgi:hypothetical protein
MQFFLAEMEWTPIFALPITNKWPVRLSARTSPFHGGKTGSIPVRATSFKKIPTQLSGFFMFWMISLQTWRLLLPVRFLVKDQCIEGWVRDQFSDRHTFPG